MNWRDKFRVGMKVRPTSDCPIRIKTRRGVMVGFARAANCIRVLLDGTKTAIVYHHCYWEQEADQEQTDGGPGPIPSGLSSENESVEEKPDELTR
jgi:hypothetical protein